MLIATVSLGDSLITLHKVWPLKDQLAQDAYSLTFTDMPTGEAHRVQVFGENKAVLMLAAWLAADERPGWDTPLIEELRKLVGHHMP